MFRNLTVADLFILVNKLNTHTICIDFFSPWPALVGLSILMVEVSRSHSFRYTNIRQDSSGRAIDSSQSPLPDTQRSLQRDIHTSGRIRTRYPSKRAAADPHLRPRDHWDPPTCTTVQSFITELVGLVKENQLITMHGVTNFKTALTLTTLQINNSRIWERN